MKITVVIHIPVDPFQAQSMKGAIIGILARNLSANEGFVVHVVSGAE